MPPHVLIILTTQWRAQSFGYAGDIQARTPHLDALAATSLNYVQAVTPHPFGPFARAALLTGKPSPENGVGDYYDPLPPDAWTWVRELRQRGYLTAFLGKWHLAPRDRPAPLVGEVHARMQVPPEYRAEFEFWEGFEGGFLLNDPWLHGSRLPEPVRFPGYQSDVLAQRAAAWWQDARRSDSRPLCVMVSLEAPHPPYGAPAAGIVPGDPREIDLAPNVPIGGEAEARARRELAGYYAHLSATDRALGTLLRAVAPWSPAVIFTSVHGDMHGAHGLFRKGWPYEESVRVPLLVRGRGEAPYGVSEEAVSLQDFSQILFALTEDRRWRCPRSAAEISMPSVVALPDQCDRRWHGFRLAERKLILHEDGTPWLDFDLHRDPWELHNFAHPGEEADDRVRKST